MPSTSPCASLSLGEVLGNDRQRPSATIGNGHRQRPSAKIGNGHRQRSAAVVSGSAAIGWALSAARPSKAGVDDAARGHLDDRIEAHDVGLDAAGPARIGEARAETHNRCPQQKLKRGQHARSDFVSYMNAMPQSRSRAEDDDPGGHTKHMSVYTVCLLR